MVIDSKGKFLRSWGKGTMSIPHSIRLDPADNVWIGDAHTSMFYKFTPEGKKLMEISVGDIPDPNRPWYVRMTLDSGCGHCGAANWRSGPLADLSRALCAIRTARTPLCHAWSQRLRSRHR